MPDDSAFATFYATSYQRLVGQVFAVTGDLADAEDAVQEAFVRASARWGKVCRYDHPEAWVRRVAINLALTMRRRARRRLAALNRLGTPAPAPPLTVDAVALAEALRQLPARQRQAVVLHHGLGLPVDEVAGQLGVPAGTVKSWLWRGRQALAGLLDEREVPHVR